MADERKKIMNQWYHTFNKFDPFFLIFCDATLPSHCCSQNILTSPHFKRSYLLSLRMTPAYILLMIH